MKAWLAIRCGVLGFSLERYETGMDGDRVGYTPGVYSPSGQFFARGDAQLVVDVTRMRFDRPIFDSTESGNLGEFLPRFEIFIDFAFPLG